MEEKLYEGNSFAKKDGDTASLERAKPEPVVTTPAKTHKRNKYADDFETKHGRSIGKYILNDMAVPLASKALGDFIISAVKVFLNSNAGTSQATQPSRKNTLVDYTKCWDDRAPVTTPNVGYREAFDDAVVGTEDQARMILRELNNLLKTYRIVRVSDLYDLAGIRKQPYTAEYYGWSDISSAKIVPVSEGYWIKMPPAVPIER